MLKYDASEDNLVFHKLEGMQMLPIDLYAKWEGRCSDGHDIGLDMKIVKQPVKKVESVRQWLDEAFEGGPSGKLSKYRVSDRAL